MTRWMRPPERSREGKQDDFDPVTEGARHGLDRELSLAIWERVCLDATDSAGRRDVEQARRRFHEVAAQLAAHGGRLRPEVGRRTRVEAEIDGDRQRAPGLDDLAVRVPGRETLAAVEARRWSRLYAEQPLPQQSTERSEPPGASEVSRAMTALQVPPQPAQRAPLDARLRTRLGPLFGFDLGGIEVVPESPMANGSTKAVTRDGEVHFRPGSYQPGTQHGDWLIAHELAHVVQHRGGRGERDGTRRELEREADRAATLVRRGIAAPIALRAQPAAYAFDEEEARDSDGDDASVLRPEVAGGPKSEAGVKDSIAPESGPTSIASRGQPVNGAVANASSSAEPAAGQEAASDSGHRADAAITGAAEVVEFQPGRRPDRLGALFGRLRDAAITNVAKTQATQRTDGSKQGGVAAADAAEGKPKDDLPRDASDKETHASARRRRPVPRKVTRTSRIGPHLFRKADPEVALPAIFLRDGAASDGERAVEATLRPSGGAPLPAAIRARLEHEFGCDLSGVRLHSDATAAMAARTIAARAFTIGESIFFLRAPDFDSPADFAILAHEVTHVVQYYQGRVEVQRDLAVSTPDHPLEREAEAMGAALAQRHPVPPVHRAGQLAAPARALMGSAGLSVGRREANARMFGPTTRDVALANGVARPHAIGRPATLYRSGDKGGEPSGWSKADDWILGVLAGDFNEDPSTSQIIVRTLLTLIPIVDQVGDVEDIAAAVYKLVWQERYNEFGPWFGLVVSLFGAIPELGSALKGVIKLIFKGAKGNLGKILKLLEPFGRQAGELIDKLINKLPELSKLLAGKMRTLLRDLASKTGELIAKLRCVPKIIAATVAEKLRRLIARLERFSKAVRAAMQAVEQRVAEAFARLRRQLDRVKDALSLARRIGFANAARLFRAVDADDLAKLVKLDDGALRKLVKLDDAALRKLGKLDDEALRNLVKLDDEALRKLVKLEDAEFVKAAGKAQTARFIKTADHMFAPGTIIKRAKGINGGHLSQDFKKALQGQGKEVGKTPVSGLPGSSKVQYKLFKMEKGKITTVLQDGDPFIKTVFDSAIWDKQKLMKLASEIFGELTKDGTIEVTHKGIKYIGWVRNGVLDSFGVK